MSNLYHREIFMPAGVRNLAGVTLALTPSHHARGAALYDRYGALTIPAQITFDGKDVVEAEFEAGKLVKVVVRLSYDDTRDAIYVCKTDGFLKTVWFNLKSDKHKTLKKHLYKSV